MFKLGSEISFIVDRDIEKDQELNIALQTALNDWSKSLGQITFNPKIKYESLGIDGAAKSNPLAAVKTWTEFKNNFINGQGNNNKIMIVLEDSGATATGGFYTGYYEPTKQVINTGILVLPRTRLSQKTREEKADLIRHELGHGFDIPHVQDPFSIEGFFDNQATMFNATVFDLALRQFTANMDPVSSDFSNGFQESDLQVINYFYPKEKTGYIKSDFYTDLIGVNLALIGRSKQAALKDSVAMPSLGGKIPFYFKAGSYSLYLRKASAKGGSLSGVWSEAYLLGRSSFKDGADEYWFRKKKGKELIFMKPTKPAHRLVTLKLTKDQDYIITLK